MKKNIGTAVGFIGFLFLSFSALAFTEGEIKQELLYQCMLNKSETLNVGLIHEESQSQLLLEVKFFTGAVVEKTVLKPTEFIRYGNATIISVNRGRSGYLLLRAQENIKPLTDGSTVLVQIDNNLFGGEQSMLFTKGELQTLPMCHKSQVP